MIGETPFLAARLQGFAEPGHSGDRAEDAPPPRPSLRVRDLGTVERQRLFNSISAYQVFAERRREPLRGGPLHDDACTLVGREEEIEILLDRWQPAKRRRGRSGPDFRQNQALANHAYHLPDA